MGINIEIVASRLLFVSVDSMVDGIGLIQREANRQSFFMFETVTQLFRFFQSFRTLQQKDEDNDVVMASSDVELDADEEDEEDGEGDDAAWFSYDDWDVCPDEKPCCDSDQEAKQAVNEAVDPLDIFSPESKSKFREPVFHLPTTRDSAHGSNECSDFEYPGDSEDSEVGSPIKNHQICRKGVRYSKVGLVCGAFP